jgi:predicted CoA-substrate-specific enzyme activase
MVTAGVDVGVKTVKVVIMKDEEVAGSSIGETNGFERGKAAEVVWEEALKKAGVAASDVEQVIATGTGKTDVAFATNNVVEPVADVKGALKVAPGSKTLIDIGAEQIRVVKYDESGKVANYTLNQQCGAGLGAFAEAMARMLGVSVDEMSELAAKSKGGVVVNGECGNYASLDIVTMVHDNVAKEDIAWGVVDAIANKIAATANLTNIDKDNVVLMGGLARNAGVVAALKRRMGGKVEVAAEPEMVGAIGAALIGADEVKGI